MQKEVEWSGVATCEECEPTSPSQLLEWSILSSIVFWRQLNVDAFAGNNSDLACIKRWADR